MASAWTMARISDSDISASSVIVFLKLGGRVMRSPRTKESIDNACSSAWLPAAPRCSPGTEPNRPGPCRPLPPEARSGRSLSPLQRLGVSHLTVRVGKKETLLARVATRPVTRTVARLASPVSLAAPATTTGVALAMIVGFALHLLTTLTGCLTMRKAVSRTSADLLGSARLPACARHLDPSFIAISPAALWAAGLRVPRSLSFLCSQRSLRKEQRL